MTGRREECHASGYTSKGLSSDNGLDAVGDDGEEASGLLVSVSEHERVDDSPEWFRLTEVLGVCDGWSEHCCVCRACSATRCRCFSCCFVVT